MTQAPPLAPIEQEYSHLRTRRKQKKRKKRLFGGTWCVAMLWNRTAAWRVAGWRVAATAGVGVYIENNRGGCFDARFSAAVSKTHHQCRKWEYGSTWTSLDNLGIRGYSPGSFGNSPGSLCREIKSYPPPPRRSPVQAVLWSRDLTNQIRPLYCCVPVFTPSHWIWCHNNYVAMNPAYILG